LIVEGALETTCTRDDVALGHRTVRRSRARGSTVIEGFHTSRRNCAPNDRSNNPSSRSVSNRSVRPPRRFAISAMPRIAAALTTSAAMTRLTDVLPVSR